MKLPFDLGVKLIFRLLTPGFFLTLGLYPALAALKDKAGWTIQLEYLFVLSVIITGWIVVILDQPVYILLEGRRYWPPLLRELFVSLEQRRLTRISDEFNNAYALSIALTYPARKKNAYQRYIETTLEMRKFPLNSEGYPEARFPTRLGNLMDAFESYPMKRYGIDAIFFWYRIWLTLDKDLREELDNRQAVADSAVYASVALFVSGLLWLGYGVLSLFGYTLMSHLPTFVSPLIPAAGFLLSSWLFYRVSGFAQYQYGETFKSIFDIYEKRIDVSRVLTKVSGITKDKSVLNKSRGDQLWIALRYLHNYKVKCLEPECVKAKVLPMTPEALKKHFESSHEVKTSEGMYKDIPDDQTYYENLRSAFEDELRVRLIKKLSVVLSLIALILGFYFGYKLFWFALAISGVTWVVEIIVRARRGQKNRIQNLTVFEDVNKLPHTYKVLPDNYGIKMPVLLPHLAVMLLTGFLLVLWATGALQSLEDFMRTIRIR